MDRDARKTAIVTAMDACASVMSRPTATPDAVREAVAAGRLALAEYGTPGAWLEAAHVELARAGMVAVEAMTTPRATVVDRRARAVELAEGARMLAVHSVYEVP